MPTGYTAIIKEGVGFPEFALHCARAFGALVTVRDEPSNTPIPIKLKPDIYHQKRLAAARRRLSQIKNLTIGEMLEHSGHAAKLAYRKELRSVRKTRKESYELRCQYVAMLEKVWKWQLPTLDHADLKKFMLQQIQGSIESDCSGEFLEDPELLSPAEYLGNLLKQIEQDIEYHSGEWDEEVKRTDEWNEWIHALRESLSSS